MTTNMNRYALFTTVNRPNGTDYDMAAREFIGLEALTKGIEATIKMAEEECKAETTLVPSSIVFSVVLT